MESDEFYEVDVAVYFSIVNLVVNTVYRICYSRRTVARMDDSISYHQHRCYYVYYDNSLQIHRGGESMMKVVINDDYGGFGLSRVARQRLLTLGYLIPNNGAGKYALESSIPRDHPLLIQVVEELGTIQASDRLAKLAIVTIPDDVEWTIEKYDGWEHVAEKHRTWHGKRRNLE